MHSACKHLSRVDLRTRNLIDVVQDYAQLSQPDADLLFHDLLGIERNASGYGRSSLNNDGSPLQFCLTSTGRGVGARLIGDPFAFVPSLPERKRLSVESLNTLVKKSSIQGLEDLTARTLDCLLPNDPELMSAYQDGFIWIATGIGRQGLAFYLETGPLPDSGWPAARKWLQNVLPTMDHAEPILEQLALQCTSASMGLEGSSPKNMRAKLYFRFRAEANLSSLGLDLFIHPKMIQFLNAAMKTRGVDRDGLVMSLGFSVQDGLPVDVKVDLCGHCLAQEPSEWNRILKELTDQFDIAPFGVHDQLKDRMVDVAFLGCGVKKSGEVRLNLYLRGAREPVHPSHADFRASLADALRYLMRYQRADGSFEEYDLPVGRTNQWVTAVAATSLARGGKEQNWDWALEAAERAADWLIKYQGYDQGWGYNHNVGADADSTGLVLTLLDILERPVHASQRAFLADHWCQGGGFATYLEGPGAWSDAHWDVTPLGYLQLDRVDQKRFRDDFIRFLRANETSQGTWRSYWWREPYYATVTTLESMSRLGIDDVGCEKWQLNYPDTVDNAFDLACVAGINLWRNVPALPEMRELLRRQNGDGSWHGFPNLRVTEDTCYQPWEHPEGDYYRDDDGIMTTAIVARSLLLFFEKNGQGHPTNEECLSHA